MKSERGVSTVVGYVLLVAITITGSGLMLYGGMAAMDTVSDQNQDEQAQQAMSQFSSEASLVALGNIESREIEYGNTHDGHIDIRQNASTIEVYVENGSNTTHLLNETSLGAIVYENGDTEIAYEGGGVWRKQGDYSQMVSPPEYHYQDRTLTFPVIRVLGEGRAQGNTQLTVERLNTTNRIDYENPITEGEVYITVQSDYCEGWRHFFEERTGGSVTECDNQTVTAELVVPQEDSLEQGIAVGNGYEPPSGNTDMPSNISENAEFVNVERSIDNKVDSAADDNDNTGSCISESSFEGGCTLTNGTYFVNSSTQLENSVDFNTSDGPIDIVINGDFDISNQELLNVDNDTENGVEYYVNGDLELQDAVVKTQNSAIESQRNIFFVADGVATESESLGNAELDIVLYAPNADISLTGGGNPVIRGAVYANSLSMQGGGNTEIQYDDGLEDFTLEMDTRASAVTYLHLSENRLRVAVN